MKRMVAMGFVFGTYAVYMGCSLLAGEPLPDGVLFGSVVAVVAGLAGYTAGKLPVVRTLKKV